MSKLASHPNLFNCCLNLLRRKGYTLKLYSDDGSVDFAHLTWEAVKEGDSYTADNPIELLGLIAIEDNLPERDSDPRVYWNFEEDIWDELFNNVISEVDG